MAEAAAAGTPARDFQRQPVVHGPHGDHLPGWIRGVIDVRHDTTHRAGIVRNQGDGGRRGGFRAGGKKRRYINAGYMACLKEHPFAGPVFVQGLFEQLQHIGQAFFAITKNHDIYEGRQRFGAEQGSAPGNNQGAGRQVLRPVGCAQGNACKIKHVKHIGIAKFVRYGKAQAMHLRQGRV